MSDLKNMLINLSDEQYELLKLALKAVDTSIELQKQRVVNAEGYEKWLELKEVLRDRLSNIEPRRVDQVINGCSALIRNYIGLNSVNELKPEHIPVVEDIMNHAIDMADKYQPHRKGASL